MSLGDGISAIVGSIVIGCIIMPDITRFLRSSTGALVTSGASYDGVSALCNVGGLQVPPSLWRPNDIITIMLTLGLGLGAFAIIIAGSWVLNAFNLYSAVLGVTASFPRLTARNHGCFGRHWCDGRFHEYSRSFVEFLFYLSVVFIPVAGVVIVDHFCSPEAYRS